MHVLIIEDDLDLGPALLSSLLQEGVTGVWVRHCADAVAHLEASGVPPPDALLLDLSLPDGDGFGLLRRWRERRQGVPVLVISARAALEDRLAALDGGADDYLVKPFAMAELDRGRAGAAAQGSGLGLAIVRQALQRLQGRLELRPGLRGQGVGFAIELPRGPAG